MIDPDNIPLSNAYELLVHSHASFFLSGKAGTGKTTMIRNAIRTAKKNCIVVAPTGIAALSANGYTIHSFFGLPIGVIGRDIIGKVRAQYCERIRETDTIIIDEVSMVRCDVMDAVERTLRNVLRNTEPFGGIQMVFVGDLFQLEPVVTDDDRPKLEKLYGKCGYHFFDAECMDYINVPKIYLDKVYRQDNCNFVGLLDKVRDGSLTDLELDEINSRTIGQSAEDGFAITLTSFNADAVRINMKNLSELPGPPKNYNAIYEGDCSALRSAVEDTLELKIGARVVFIINDDHDIKRRRWMNGTMGIIRGLHPDSVDVEMNDGSIYNVGRYTWHISNTVYDKSTGTTAELVIGKISQIPLRLAWAITIHKSQSMTFDKVRIDVGRGAFSCGQVYVALSRARSMDGLYLNRPISRESVMVSDEVLSYSEAVNDQSAVEVELLIAEMTDNLMAEMKYDQAAQILLELSYEAAMKSDIATAERLADKFFCTVIDDRGIQIMRGDYCVSDYLNAVYSFYSGDISCPMKYLSALTEYTTDEYYLLMRCNETAQNNTKFIDLLESFLVDADDAIQSGLPSDRYRKVLFTAARSYQEMGERLSQKCLVDLFDDVYRYPGNLIVAREIIFSSLPLWEKISEWCGKQRSEFCDKLLSYKDAEFITVVNKLCKGYSKELHFSPTFEHIFDKFFEQIYKYICIDLHPRTQTD